MTAVDTTRPVRPVTMPLLDRVGAVPLCSTLTRVLDRGKRSKQDHGLGVDADPLGGLRLDHPGQLHDRATGRGEDQALDIPCLALDAVALAANDGYLRDWCHRRHPFTAGGRCYGRRMRSNDRRLARAR